MVGAFPLAKLGFLVVKQISKPIANSIAGRAKSSRLFREYVCIPVAQLFHWYDVKVRMRILNLGKVTTIPKLNQEKAIETGSQLLSEFIILSIASSMLVYEYRRSSEKEEARQAEVEREKQEMANKVMCLELAVDKQSAQIRELTRLAHSVLEKRQERVAAAANESSNPQDAAFSNGESENDLEGLIGSSAADLLDSTPHPALPASRSNCQSSVSTYFFSSSALKSTTTALFPETGDEQEAYRNGAIMEAVQIYLDGCPE